MMDDQHGKEAEDAEGSFLVYCCKCVVFSLALIYVVVKMCLECVFRRPKNQIDYYKGQRTVTVTAPDGSRIVAHKKELVEKGRLKEAEGSVTHYGSNQGEEVWSRQWMGTTRK